MTLHNVLDFAKEVMNQSINDGDIAIDATAGKGSDTLFLARRVGESGKVYSFDIQKEALDQTSQLLHHHQLDNRVTLFQQGHEQANSLIPVEEQARLKTVVFNLGYLPGGNKQITTQTNTTVQAVSDFLDMLPSGGLLVVVVYHGHEEGKKEKEALETYSTQLNQQQVQVLRYEFVNQVNRPPFLLLFQKR
ncbi:methyltransferase domain-containing protein [Salibacterium salarium]|uniref:Methyltransferase domain-containing protein n=1 Tax=Salibacterium salarium TaxID=284579 RepID=A0A3R9QKM6_9BACI|nr:class I SAM-dependent methyltransferase [Salibacterium salarium]RSL32883.1 methyltransferase domain-containing protein [Salibacterium salarium]